MRRHRWLGILCAALITGCNGGREDADTTPAAAPAAPQPPATPERPSVGRWTPDDENARIAREEVPGYAGRYRAGSSTVVLLTDSASIDEAREYIAGRPRAGRPDRGVRFVIVRYDANELLRWRHAASRLMASRTDIYSLDLDEVHNRISIGVRAGSEAEVKGLALAAGIPADALHVSPEEMEKPMN